MSRSLGTRRSENVVKADDFRRPSTGEFSIYLDQGGDKSIFLLGGLCHPVIRFLNSDDKSKVVDFFESLEPIESPRLAD